MKSKNNNTGYDDKLFYQAITASLKTVLTAPVAAPYKMTADWNHSIYKTKVTKGGLFKVQNPADGEITNCLKTSDSYLITINHNNGVSSTFYNVTPEADIPIGTKFKQGETIGTAKNSFDFVLAIDPALIFAED